MMRHGSSRRVVIQGTVCPAEYEVGWIDSSTMLMANNGEEYSVIDDEIGAELSDHIHDTVLVHGVLEDDLSDRPMIRVWRFDILTFGSGDDLAYDFDLDGDGVVPDYELDDFDDESWASS